MLSMLYCVCTDSVARVCMCVRLLYSDIVEYLRPNQCSDFKFRSMWASFEWENKVSVHTPIT